MSEDSLTLTEQQYDLLVAAERCDGEPRVVAAETLDAIRDVLEPAVSSTGVRDASVLSVQQLAMQLAESDSEPDALVQNPETTRPTQDELKAGDGDDEPASAADALADLERDDPAAAREVRKTLAKSRTVSDRLPEHSNALRRQASRRLGLDDESAVDELLESDEIPSDPRLV